MNYSSSEQMQEYAKDFAKLYQNFKTRDKYFNELKDVYRLIFKHSPNGIVLLDEENTIIDYNNSFADLAKDYDLKGKMMGNIFPELDQICKREEDIYLEDIIIGKKEEIMIAVNINIIKNEDLRIIKLLQIEDLSEKWRMEEQKKQFINLVKHELNTPINAIVGFLAVLRNLMAEEKKENLDEMFEYIEKSSLRLSKTISELLKMSEIMSEKIKIRKEKFKISDLILEIIEDRKKDILKKKINLEFIQGRSIDIKGDYSLFKTAIDNLIDNAISFNKVGGEVKIKTVYEEDRFKIIIADKGQGFSKKEEKYIGDAFYQVENYKIRKKQGLGLGITIAKRIIELHGGKIYFVSDIDKGTSVIIEIGEKGCIADENIEKIKEDYEKKIKDMENQMNKYAEDLIKVYRLKN